MNRFVLPGSVAALASLPVLALAQTPYSTVYAFTNLHPRSPVTGALPASDTGDTANGASVGSGYADWNETGSNALRWNADGTTTDLHAAATGILGVNGSSFAGSIDANGVVVGGGNVSGGRTLALRWNTDGTVTNLQSLVPGTVRQSSTLRVQNGIAAGYANIFVSGTTYRDAAVRWNPDNTVKNLGALPGTVSLLGSNGTSSAYALDGAVTVGFGRGSAIGNRTHALRWNADDTVTDLNVAASALSGLNSTSSALFIRNGVTVGTGGGSNFSQHALRWNANGSVTDLHTQTVAGGFDSSVAYSTANGVTVGFATGGNANNNLFVSKSLAWLPNGTVVNLGAFVPGGDASTDSKAFAIDAATGVISGSAYGVPNAALWTPLVSGGTNALTVRPGDATTIHQNFTQSAGGTLVNGTLDMAGNTFTVAGGTFGGAGTVIGGLAVTGGTLIPGNSPGTLTLDGDFAMSNGNYTIELASLTSFDVLAATGSATFTGGTFGVTTLGGFNPMIGDFFNIVTTGSGITGTGSVSVPAGYTFTQSGTSGRLTYVGIAVVPEAGSGLLALLAAVPGVGIALTRANRRRR